MLASRMEANPYELNVTEYRRNPSFWSMFIQNDGFLYAIKSRFESDF